MVSDRSVKVAKYGPVTAITFLIGVGVVVAIAVQAFELPSLDAISQDTYFVGLGGLFTLFGAVGFYQALFILRHPQAAIEHDVQPPSKYDLSFDTRRGAKKVGALTLLGSSLALALGLYAVVTGL